MVKLNTKNYNLKLKNNKLVKVVKPKAKPIIAPKPAFTFSGTGREMLDKLFNPTTTKKEVKSMVKQFGYKNKDLLINDLSELGKQALNAKITPSRLKNLKERNLIENMKGLMNGEENFNKWLNEHGITEEYIKNHFDSKKGLLALPNGDVYKWAWEYNQGDN